MNKELYHKWANKVVDIQLKNSELSTIITLLDCMIRDDYKEAKKLSKALLDEQAYMSEYEILSARLYLKLDENTTTKEYLNITLEDKSNLN